MVLEYVVCNFSNYTLPVWTYNCYLSYYLPLSLHVTNAYTSIFKYMLWVDDLLSNESNDDGMSRGNRVIADNPSV
ncbi:protein of unknown function [Candidatus Nitrosocaldus cavascurensis]|uniref:Uncharacterized protein n=1 Tax=Candidatus Nitrosocaldus cavascurensis TaxID=2058097 RepID=A0A2K5AS62_9ARCH|nr:protein of unknown function [Candidatus Nitrosocaldus cavascurensis]